MNPEQNNIAFLRFVFNRHRGVRPRTVWNKGERWRTSRGQGGCFMNLRFGRRKRIALPGTGSDHNAFARRSPCGFSVPDQLHSSRKIPFRAPGIPEKLPRSGKGRFRRRMGKATAFSEIPSLFLCREGVKSPERPSLKSDRSCPVFLLCVRREF